MAYLIEALGRGLLAELSSAFKDILHDDGHYSTTELVTLVHKKPDDLKFLQLLAVRYLADRRFQQAADTFNRVLDQDNNHRDARLGLACALDELGATEDAQQHLQTSADQYAEHAATLFALGFCQERRGLRENAFATYNRAIETDPELRGAYERLAAMHIANGQPHPAIDCYEQICCISPGEIEPILTLGALYIHEGDYEEAIRHYQFALALEPDNWEVQEDLVTACAETGRYEEGIELLLSMIDAKPNCAEHHMRLGDLYTRAGRCEDAGHAYQAAVNINPDYLEATIKIGTNHLRAGRYTEAARWFNRAVELNDRMLTAFVGMGVAQQRLGMNEEALRSFEMAANVEPNSSLLFSESARLYLKTAPAEQVEKYLSTRSMADDPNGPNSDDVTCMLERQIANIRAAIERSPNHADLYYRLGLLLRQTGDVDGATEAYQQAVAINPNYVKAIMKLGLALRDQGKVAAAIDCLKRAVDLDSEPAQIHYELGLLYASRDQFNHAVKQFEQACDASPRNVDFRAHLSLALQNMGLMDRAKASWQVLSEIVKETPRGRNLMRHLLH